MPHGYLMTSADLGDKCILEKDLTVLHEVHLSLEKRPLKNRRALGFAGQGCKISTIDVADARSEQPHAWAVESGCPEVVESLV